jgi:hypothetical protein
MRRLALPLLVIACLAASGCLSFDHGGVDEPVVSLLGGHAWIQTTTAQGERAGVTLFALRDETSGEVLVVYAAVLLRDPSDGQGPRVLSDEATLELEGVDPRSWSLGTLAGGAFPLPPDELARRRETGWAGIVRDAGVTLPIAIPAKQIRELLHALAAPAPRDAVRFDVSEHELREVLATASAAEPASR